MKKPTLPLLAAAAIVGASLGALGVPQVHAQDKEVVVPEIEWDTALKKFQVDSDKFIGQRFSVACPPHSVRDTMEQVYGTDAYPSDNAICVAALHAGKITTEDGGQVMVQLNPGLEAYTGSSRNGVDSASLPGTQRSMVFVDAESAAAADEARQDYIPRLKWDAKFTGTGLANKDLKGQVMTFNCPAAPGDLRMRRVVGTDSYAFNSIVCLAAVHAGKITTAEGGLVNVQIDPGMKKLVGSIRNGVETKNGGGGHTTISFVDAPLRAAATPTQN
ncbi:LCCL domain-containing protein [Pelagibius sp.]|uniref:LCCL domain-containing protein n=1 Tax=Pelagibius sp. TaxID=1931238 RepID=UPI003B50CEC7